MKIAIDSGPLSSGHAVRGIGTYTSELLKALRLKGVDLWKEDLSKYDIVHFTAFNPFFVSIPFRKPKRTKFILTIYDLIPLIYPKHYPPGVKGRIKFLINKYLINKNVDAIITISETSKKDICRLLGVIPNRVHVIYLAPKAVFKKLNSEEVKRVKIKYGLPDKFALYVGDVNYNKNIPNLVKACKLAKISLVICGKQALEVERKLNINELSGPMDFIRYLFGKPHPEIAHYTELQELFKYKNIIRLGFVDDNDLAAIYNLASVYVQPSFYEGFGFPVLEAIACGCPVVANKTQALTEIAEGAVTFVDATNPKEIVKGIRNLIRYPKLPRKYSWEKTAKETREIYAKV